MNIFISVGVLVRDIILFSANLLVYEAAPGLVALALIITLLIAVVLFWLRTARQSEAARWLRQLIAKSATEEDFCRDIAPLSASIDNGATTRSRRQLATAWNEYKETFVKHDENDTAILRNAVRPSTFLNVEDLGFTAGAWRILPGLFVTIGLFLTFLGLISALNAMSQDSEINSRTMTVLLKIASAKFIMSLTGLFCSIVFTIAFRAMYGGVERSVHQLCKIIEDRLNYISLEDLAAEQLRATREQREHFRLIGMELVAEIGRPLREELPAAISNSISVAMAPLVDRVGKMGAEGVGNMVQGLSTQLTDKVGIALAEASQNISDAGEKIGQLADRMDKSSGRMGSEMEDVATRVAEAVEGLQNAMTETAETTGGVFTEGAEKLLSVMNQTLEGIRDNTGEGARAMSAAAEDMRMSAAAFKNEIESAAQSGSEAAQARMQEAGIEASGHIGSAGLEVAAAFSRTGEEISHAAEAFSKKATRELISPIESIAAQLGDMVSKLQQGSTDMRKFSESVRAGAEASGNAATNFKEASGDLVGAATPIHSIVERMENSIRLMTDSTQHAASSVSRAAEATAQSAADALASAQEILGSEARAIEAALLGVSTMLERQKGQGDRLDDMDEKLGKAFETYTDEVAKAVDGMFGHVRDMQERLNPALDTMSNIVAQMEDFAPQSRRP
ncbi:MAG: MotA/TolQ/ExbB proton channel family protein [Rhizobiaceae bacterium]|nr:MotA/TolQ/ExbB proton channel family protein [Rhizobiaceae bacterium]